MLRISTRERWSVQSLCLRRDGLSRAAGHRTIHPVFDRGLGCSAAQSHGYAPPFVAVTRCVTDCLLLRRGASCRGTDRGVVRPIGPRAACLGSAAFALSMIE